MIRNLSVVALGAAALAACNPEPETIIAGEQPDSMARELANAPAVELPPAIAASKTYRCKDNSLVRIDWLQGGHGANLRVGDASAPTRVRSAPAEEGKPPSAELVAEGGYALTGDPAATSISLTLPDKGKQSCHV
jgi:hypothetical protein